MAVKDVNERTAKLEAHFDAHKEHTDKKFDEVVQSLASIEKNVTQINLALARSRSFIAGISFAFAAVGSLLMLVLQTAAKKMGFI